MTSPDQYDDQIEYARDVLERTAELDDIDTTKKHLEDVVEHLEDIQGENEAYKRVTHALNSVLEQNLDDLEYLQDTVEKAYTAIDEIYQGEGYGNQQVIVTDGNASVTAAQTPDGRHGVHVEKEEEEPSGTRRWFLGLLGGAGLVSLGAVGGALLYDDKDDRDREDTEYNTDEKYNGDSQDTSYRKEDELGENVQTFTFEGKRAISVGEIDGGDDAVLCYAENEGHSNVIAMHNDHGTFQFVSEDDRIFADSEDDIWTQVDGIWDEIRDGDVEGC